MTAMVPEKTFICGGRRFVCDISGSRASRAFCRLDSDGGLVEDLSVRRGQESVCFDGQIRVAT